MTKLLKRSVAAEMAGMCDRTLARKIAAGEGPEITAMGRRVFVTEEALEAWIKSHTIQPGGNV